MAFAGDRWGPYATLLALIAISVTYTILAGLGVMTWPTMTVVVVVVVMVVVVAFALGAAVQIGHGFHLRVLEPRTPVSSATTSPSAAVLTPTLVTARVQRGERLDGSTLDGLQLTGAPLAGEPAPRPARCATPPGRR
jgi:hypothetical protein